MVLYVATALLGTTLFFFLHHLGNQISYKTAVQRFVEEFETYSRNEGYTRRFITPFEYCQMAGMVLAGSKKSDESPLYQAILPKGPTLWDSGPHDLQDYCEELAAEVNGRELRPSFSKLRYWWGKKAVFALALPYLSVAELRNLVRFGSYAGWIALAAILLLFAPRTLFIISPLVVLGAFASGIRYFSDFVNGLPYMFTVWSSAALALLLLGRMPSRMTPADHHQLIRFFCFIVGLTSAYLSTLDGHTILLITLIGLLIYFGSGQLNSTERRRLAAWCIGLYVVGFIASYGLGLTVKIVGSKCLIPDWLGGQQFCGADIAFSDQAMGYVQRTIWEISFSLRESLEGIPLLEHVVHVLPTLDDDPWYRRINRISLLTDYWTFAGIRNELWSALLTWVWILLLLVSTAVAMMRSRQRRTDLLQSTIWIWVLISLVTLQLLVSNDLHYRISRYVFVLCGMSMSCVLLALMETRFSTWNSQAAKGFQWPNFLRQNNFRYAAWTGLVLFTALLYATRGEISFKRVQDIVETGLEESTRIASGPFDLYLDDNTLVYVKKPCVYRDLINPFFLHIFPVDRSDLAQDRQQYDFNNLDFGFGSRPFYYQLMTSNAPIFLSGGQCFVLHDLPDYPIAAIRTGQYRSGKRPVSGKAPVWKATFNMTALKRADTTVQVEEYPKIPFDSLDERRVFERFDTPGLWTSSDSAYVINLLASKSAIIHSNFNVYLIGDRLVYAKQPCRRKDVVVPFVLHVYPLDWNDLPAHRRQYPTDDLDFEFQEFGHQVERTCLAIRHLPAYPIVAIHTGQGYLAGLDPRIKSFSTHEASANIYQFGEDTYVGRRILFSFENDWERWKSDDDAIVKPTLQDMHDYLPFITRSVGTGFLTSYQPALDGKRDVPTGQALSPMFTATAADYLVVLIRGGEEEGNLGLRLFADEQLWAILRGTRPEEGLDIVFYSLAEVADKILRLELFDYETQYSIALDHVMLMRRAATGLPIDNKLYWEGRFNFLEQASYGENKR